MKEFFTAREVVLSPTISNRRRAEPAPGQVSAVFESSIVALYNLLIYYRNGSVLPGDFGDSFNCIHRRVSNLTCVDLLQTKICRPRIIGAILVSNAKSN
jgi:hypothetical protein